MTKTENPKYIFYVYEDQLGSEWNGDIQEFVGILNEILTRDYPEWEAELKQTIHQYDDDEHGFPQAAWDLALETYDSKFPL